ncbi:MAG TPA: aldose epimerase family protein [Chthoniobacteraceae bacterium]|jgi:aldose 1-epimerase|nr:aldose epimerase family protein [Chthoniobacteraceae bacterium]
MTLISRFSVFAALLSLALAGANGAVEKAAAFQTADGPVDVFTLTNAHGLRARVLTWGATLVSMSAPDRDGKLADVTLGFDDLERYTKPHPFFGSIAGRYANRIGQGRFELDGHTYTLAKNNGANHLHGGVRGFDKRIWKAEPQGDDAVRLTYTSVDGEEGYPGTLRVAVTYQLTAADGLSISYEATTDKATVLNLTNHTYWNLAGSGDVLGHELRLNAAHVTAVDPGLIPTGEYQAVAGTPLDFTTAKPLGRDIAALKGEGLPGGYDHNFVIDAKPGTLSLAAEVRDPASGRTMRVRTTQPGVQLYTANGLSGVTGRGGQAYGPYGALCLETQHFPDSPNHPNFPTTVLRPGETFKSVTVYEFSAR